MFNYFNILINNATKTLTWDELAKLHRMHKHDPVKHKLKNHPNIFHTHVSYNGEAFYPSSKKTELKKKIQIYYDKFDKIVYIYRNPFDTMISYYKFLKNRKIIPYAKISLYKMNLLTFTKYYIKRWVNHIKSTKHIADVVLNYDELRINPIGFKDAIELTGVKVDMDIFNKTIEISSFDSIKKMSDEVNQPYGLAGDNYKGYFCRDGRTGQYKEVMKKGLIGFIKNKCKAEGIEI